VFATNGACPWSFVAHIFNNFQPSHGANFKTFEAVSSIDDEYLDLVIRYIIKDHPLWGEI
jgi:hypothetical protein